MPRRQVLRASSSLTNKNSNHHASPTTTTTTRPEEEAPQQQPQQHLVLIGGGHAHAQVIKALHSQARPRHLRVTLMDQQAAATYSGMVPGCIAGIYDTVNQAQIDVAQLAAWAGMDFVHDRVVDIDFERKLVYTRNPNAEPIPYDALSIDIGSTSRDIDVVPGARQYTIPTRPIDKLVRRLQQRRAQEQPQAEDDDDDNDDEQSSSSTTTSTRIVVVGGGIAGIELSMAVQAQFPTARVTLVTPSPTLLPHDPQVNDAQRHALYAVLQQEQGVHVQHGAVVKRVEEHSLILEDEHSQKVVAFDHCLWATGAAAHPLAFHLQQSRGLACTDHGWIQVSDTLQSISHPEVFAAGDCAHILSSKGAAPPPKAGVYAVRAGPVLVENLTRYLQDQIDAKLQLYQPQDDFMKLLVCSRTKALGLRFGLALYGKWVLQIKHAIDVQFLQLFQDLPTDVSYIQRGDYDTSQYDAVNPLADVDLPVTPAIAAHLLQRTDDDVDWKQAWLVLRTMTSNVKYRQQVLEHCNVTPSKESPYALQQPASPVAQSQ